MSISWIHVSPCKDNQTIILSLHMSVLKCLYHNSIVSWNCNLILFVNIFHFYHQERITNSGRGISKHFMSRYVFIYMKMDRQPCAYCKFSVQPTEKVLYVSVFLDFIDGWCDKWRLWSDCTLIKAFVFHQGHIIWKHIWLMWLILFWFPDCCTILVFYKSYIAFWILWISFKRWRL